MWDEWKIGNLVGSGGMGSVYRALHSKTGDIVAVKKIRIGVQAKPDDSDIFNEMKLLQTQRHENIVSLLDLNSDNEEISLYMEWCDAGSFTTLIQNFGPLPEDLIKTYIIQIQNGLEYLHEQKVIHRDLKPSNILLDSKGNVKLSDFGCSEMMKSTITKNQMVETLKGSVLYMAPEQIKQEFLSRKSDIWSLGCTLIELVSGKSPWSELNFENMFAIMMYIGIQGKTPQIPEGLSEELCDFINSCLKINAQERLTASELLKHNFITNKSLS